MSERAVRCKLCGRRMSGGGKYIYFCKNCRVYRDPNGEQWKWSTYKATDHLTTSKWEPITDDPLTVWRDTIESLDLGEDF